MSRATSHFKIRYIVIFAFATFISFLMIYFFDSKVFRSFIPIYFILIFGILLLRYIYVLFILSKLTKENYQELHEKHKGFSKFKGIQIVSPMIAFDKSTYTANNDDIIKLSSELRYLLLFLVLSFLLGTTMAIIVTI